MFDFTNPDWAPALNLGHAKAVETDLTRHQRLVDRKERDRTRTAAASLLELQDCKDRDADCDDDGNTNWAYRQYSAGMQEEIQRLLSENMALKEKLLRVNL